MEELIILLGGVILLLAELSTIGLLLIGASTIIACFANKKGEYNHES